MLLHLPALNRIQALTPYTTMPYKIQRISGRGPRTILANLVSQRAVVPEGSGEGEKEEGLGCETPSGNCDKYLITVGLMLIVAASTEIFP